MAATATVNPDGTLKLNFTGKASGIGNLTVTAKNITGTLPVDPVTAEHNSTEPVRFLARVLAEGIADKPASSRTGLVALIDGNAALPAGGGTITDSSGSGNDGTVASAQEPAHETTGATERTGAYEFDGATTTRFFLATSTARLADRTSHHFGLGLPRRHRGRPHRLQVLRNGT